MTPTSYTPYLPPTEIRSLKEPGSKDAGVAPVAREGGDHIPVCPRVGMYFVLAIHR